MPEDRPLASFSGYVVPESGTFYIKVDRWYGTGSYKITVTKR
jgi:hypothetical protein